MKINLDVLNKQQTQKTSSTNKMRFADGAESIIFKMFTENIYSNPIGAVVREITSNCFDSHIEAGVNNPILIKKTYEEKTDTHYISFIDFGVGLSPDRMLNIYGVYFESTKRNSNEQIGGFGLGCKTPLAYKRSTGEKDHEYDNSFNIITNFNGTKYYYTVFEGKKSPEFTLFHSENTTERNGTEIRVPMLERDIYKFESEIINQLYYFENIVFEEFSDTIKNDYQIIKGKNFLHRGNSVDNKIHICLGRVYYPIDYRTLELDESEYALPVAIDVPIGKIGVTASRETLEYSDSTIRFLKKRLKETKAELISLLQEQYINVTTLEEYFQSANNFGILNLSDTHTLNLKSVVKKSEVSFTNFKYDEFKLPKDDALFNIFFEAKQYGVKRNKYNNHYHIFLKNYSDIIEATNIYYCNEEKFKLKRIKQAYLKEKHGGYYVIRKKPLGYNRLDLTEVLNCIIEGELEEFRESKIFKRILEIQEDYFKIIQNNIVDYNDIEIPSDFTVTYGKPILDKDLLKRKISYTVSGDKYKEKTTIENFVNFNGIIFYGTYIDDYETSTAVRIMKEIGLSKYICSGWGYRYTEGSTNSFYGWCDKNSHGNILFILVAKNNLKYLEHCKDIRHISKFGDWIIRRKEEKIRNSYISRDIHNKFQEINGFYMTDLFKKISPKWFNMVMDIHQHVEKIDNNWDLEYDKSYLSRYINLDNIQPNGIEKHIIKNIAKIIKIQKKNKDVLSYFNYGVKEGNIIVSEEMDNKILPGLLKKAMSI
jgi:hypothetical protein